MDRRKFLKLSAVAPLASGQQVYSDVYGRATKMPPIKGGTCLKCGGEVDYYETHYQNKKNPRVVLHLQCGGKTARISGDYWLRFDG